MVDAFEAHSDASIAILALSLYPLSGVCLLLALVDAVAHRHSAAAAAFLQRRGALLAATDAEAARAENSAGRPAQHGYDSGAELLAEVTVDERVDAAVGRSNPLKYRIDNADD